MWRRVNNLVNSLITYQTLSPDSRFRRHVSQWLQQRPHLTCDQWFETFWQSENISRLTTEFVYHAFESYSGLQFAYVIPDDRLEDDLFWTHVCWFDWEINFFADVEAQFHVDISDCFLYEKICTIADLVRFLDQKILNHQNIEEDQSDLA
ncbi:MAG: hypothetical protein AAF327_18945 [Cyanobacteria bacterium P01_A01_bin.37]